MCASRPPARELEKDTQAARAEQEARRRRVVAGLPVPTEGPVQRYRRGGRLTLRDRAAANLLPNFAFTLAQRDLLPAEIDALAKVASAWPDGMPLRSCELTEDPTCRCGHYECMTPNPGVTPEAIGLVLRLEREEAQHRRREQRRYPMPSRYPEHPERLCRCGQAAICRCPLTWSTPAGIRASRTLIVRRVQRPCDCPADDPDCECPRAHVL